MEKATTQTFHPYADWDLDRGEFHDARALLNVDDRYTLGGELGRGGMGAVLLARDNRLGRTVAMKRLLKASPSEEELDRFLLEARVTGQLTHPNIVDVHEVGTDDDGRPYFTMQYVHGNETLESVIERLRDGDAETHRLYSMERRVQIVLQIAHALQFAHEKGVVHRDLKPANVMVGPFGEVLLIDWGLALLAEKGLLPRGPGLPNAESPYAPITLAGDPAFTDAETLLGTPFYMAPEQLLEGAEARSDVYSLAAVLYELLSLRHYLGTPSTQLKALFSQILRDEPAPADEHRGGMNGRVPRELAAITARGLAKNPDERIQSAGALANALQGWLEGDCTERCPNSFVLKTVHAYRRALQNHPGPATLLTLGTAATFLFSVVFTLSRLIP